MKSVAHEKRIEKHIKKSCQGKITVTKRSIVREKKNLSRYGVSET